MIWVALILSGFLAFYAAYILHKAWHWHRIKPFGNEFEPLSVTIIIPARDEEVYVGRCLQAVQEQEYVGEWEVIVVDDHSTDNTAAIIEEFSANDSRIRGMQLGEVEGNSYKKAALEMAIAQANGQIILTTDADCVAGPQWLTAMVAGFDTETAMVSGPVLLDGNTPFTSMQALEFMGLIAVGGASISAGNPNMCNGANLAYRKSVFHEVNGFEGIKDIASGDDELLMHKIGAQTQYKIRFAKDKRAAVATPAQPTLGAFARQRIRWVSKSTHYQNSGITAVLAASWLAMWAFPAWGIATILNPMNGWGLLGAFLLKMLAEASILIPASRFLGRGKLLIWLPLEQIPHIIYVIWAGIAGNFSSVRWKGRKVK